jgi:hypothetical protein
MLRKKEVFTTITPIPSFIPRQLAIDILHSHGEVLTVNPLVLEYKPVKAPRDAAADEFYSTWYEITERIQYVPGMGKMGSGKISFKGVFHDMPWGLQTHIYAPMNIDMRVKYRIAGNQQGVEPPEPQEIGLGAPSDGLYLREDIEIKCNITMVSFVKAQMKAASKDMVERIVKKAELLDSGVLHAMIEDGKLKTFNPADRSNTFPSQPSPTYGEHAVPNPPMSPRMPYQIPPRSPSLNYNRPGTGNSQGHAQPQASQTAGWNSVNIPMELPGDFYHSESHLQPPPSTPGHLNRESTISSASGFSEKDRRSPDPNQARWSATDYQSSQGSRPTSYSSDGIKSPGLDQKGFAAELPTHTETNEEYRPGSNSDALKKLEARGGNTTQYPTYAYNPQDYVDINKQAREQQRQSPQSNGQRYYYAQ